MTKQNKPSNSKSEKVIGFRTNKLDIEKLSFLQLKYKKGFSNIIRYSIAYLFHLHNCKKDIIKVSNMEEDDKITILNEKRCISCKGWWGDNRKRRIGKYKGKITCDTCNKLKG